MDEFAFRSKKPGTTVGQSATILRLKKLGVSHSQIGSQLGTTKSAIDQVMASLKRDGHLKDEDIPPRSWAQARREGRKMRGTTRPSIPESEDE